MLTKQQRYSFRNGAPKKSTACPFFVLRYEPAEEFSYAVVVSKKVSTKAVDRNRIKRMFRKALGNIVNDQEVDYSIVFYVRKNCVDVPFEMLEKTIEQMLKKEGIITK